MLAFGRCPPSLGGHTGLRGDLKAAWNTRFQLKYHLRIAQTSQNAMEKHCLKAHSGYGKPGHAVPSLFTQFLFVQFMLVKAYNHTVTQTSN